MNLVSNTIKKAGIYAGLIIQENTLDYSSVTQPSDAVLTFLMYL